MIFVDTNYFLRFLLKDIDAQHKKAKSLFSRAALGKVKAFSSVLVFFEIYWVLASFYEKEKDELVEILNKILAMEFIKLGERPLLEEAVQTFANTTLELEDAYNLAYAKANQAANFKTFDQKLAKYFEEVN